jgi:hypothetical protein
MPDPRNAKKQEYCFMADCRKASKAAAQARWLAKKENRNYFRSSYNVRRVQEWRARHPGYWRNRLKAKNTLQDDSAPKTVKKQSVSDKLAKDALQDLSFLQHPVLVGLIAHLTGDTLQDDIVNTTRHMQQLGSDILSSTLTMQGGDYVNKKSYMPGPDP